MNPRVRIELQPLGKVILVDRGTPLPQVLFQHGVEFPCGGKGRCRGCKVKVLKGDCPITPDQEQKLSEPELKIGWRLACCGRADGDLTLEVAQWEASILADESTVDFTPAEGLGVAVDVGTTTVVAQLLDRHTGFVLGVRSALNAQAAQGADIMTRVQFALSDHGQAHLESLLRRQIGQMILELLEATHRRADALRDIVLVGNTVMHHLFCGLRVAPLSRYPFETPWGDARCFCPAEVGWALPKGVTIRFLPCLGGFVGSDVLAGLLATGLHQRDALGCLIDLGTNGEIVVGNRERMLCASTAAGPAFEGARISMGMRAATGAISEVVLDHNRMICTVLGAGPARGICGSGLVDAAAAGVELGIIQPNGRFKNREEPFMLQPPVQIFQADIRELQLAKGAIAAGIRILLEQWGARTENVDSVFLAGAFGNYINRESARKIGLHPFAADQVRPAGNTALRGAKLALFGGANAKEALEATRQRVKHVSLSADARFQEIYAEEMGLRANGEPDSKSEFKL